MFNRLNAYGAQSSRGFTVQRTTRTELEYREGRGVVTVAVEPGTRDDGAPYLAVYASGRLEWRVAGQPRTGEPVTAGDRERIIGSIREALSFLQLDYVIE